MGGKQTYRRHSRRQDQLRLIRAAAIAAPNPLSMFTTVTPAAQLLSIVSRAATTITTDARLSSSVRDSSRWIPGDTNVGKPCDCVSCGVCGHRGLFGHRQVTRAGGDDEDGPAPNRRRRTTANEYGPAELVPLGAGDRPLKRPCRRRRGASHQQAVTAFHDSLRDRDHLIVCLPFPENHLWKALPRRPVVIDSGERQGLVADYAMAASVSMSATSTSANIPRSRSRR